jgi:extradiol dioxygenase family protein
VTTPFHLAFSVSDIEATRRFYEGLLGCEVGRESERWIDFDLGGNQLSAHLVSDEVALDSTNLVDGDAVPARHFGLILDWEVWQTTRDRFVAAGVEWVIPPKLRFVGQPGEQATMFLRDPSGNVLEFKSFRDPEDLFRRD